MKTQESEQEKPEEFRKPTRDKEDDNHILYRDAEDAQKPSVDIVEDEKYRIGDRQTFDSRQRKAVQVKGTVTPNIKNMDFDVTQVSRHDFIGNTQEMLQQAKAWAMKNIRGTYDSISKYGEGFKFVITSDSIKKYVDKTSRLKSTNTGVHIAVLKQLPEIISRSIIIESHPDRNRGVNGKSRSSYNINKNGLVHRLYGAVQIRDDNGILKTYRVKTTLVENSLSTNYSNAHNYEVTEIELIEASHVNAESSIHAALTMTSTSSISGAKLLKGVEKSYEPGKKILDESEKAVEDSQNPKLPTETSKADERADLFYILILLNISKLQV